MKPSELLEEIVIELEALGQTVDELMALHRDVAGRDPTIREQTAAAAFLAQFYNGIENILKRISTFYEIPLPTGDTWHITLFKRFCSPSFAPLPTLFDEQLEATLAPYRRFRHVALHSYGFQLEWDRMAQGVANVEDVFEQLKSSLSDYLQTLQD